MFEKRKMLVLGKNPDDVVAIGSVFFGPQRPRDDGLRKRTKVEEFI